jgi:hypothetical protein
MRATIGLVIVLAAMLALGTGAAMSAKKKPRRTVEPATQIACTVSGCQRVPPGCHPEIEYGFDGIPTGYDMIVCTGRR